MKEEKQAPEAIQMVIATSRGTRVHELKFSDRNGKILMYKHQDSEYPFVLHEEMKEGLLKDVVVNKAQEAIGYSWTPMGKNQLIDELKKEGYEVPEGFRKKGIL